MKRAQRVPPLCGFGFKIFCRRDLSRSTGHQSTTTALLTIKHMRRKNGNRFAFALEERVDERRDSRALRENDKTAKYK